MAELNCLRTPIREVQEQFVHRVNQNVTSLPHLVNMDKPLLWFDSSSR